mmetsp:Transcript_26779/g.46165  ORF Transcript_26779/g.46165 Transcript_26779/m.46165 type:complete len:306 (+) Transcript_26779:1217-2134(+)
MLQRVVAPAIAVPAKSWAVISEWHRSRPRVVHQPWLSRHRCYLRRYAELLPVGADHRPSRANSMSVSVSSAAVKAEWTRCSSAVLSPHKSPLFRTASNLPFVEATLRHEPALQIDPLPLPAPLPLYIPLRRMGLVRKAGWLVWPQCCRVVRLLLRGTPRFVFRLLFYWGAFYPLMSCLLCESSPHLRSHCTARSSFAVRVVVEAHRCGASGQLPVGHLHRQPDWRGQPSTARPPSSQRRRFSWLVICTLLLLHLLIKISVWMSRPLPVISINWLGCLHQRWTHSPASFRISTPNHTLRDDKMSSI